MLKSYYFGFLSTQPLKKPTHPTRRRVGWVGRWSIPDLKAKTPTTPDYLSIVLSKFTTPNLLIKYTSYSFVNFSTNTNKMIIISIIIINMAGSLNINNKQREKILKITINISFYTNIIHNSFIDFLINSNIFSNL